MGEELVDQLTVRAASLDAVTVAGQHNMLPHRPLPQDAYAESDSSQRPAVGPQAIRACRRDEGRLTGTWLIHDDPVGVKCTWKRGCLASQSRITGVLCVP